MDDDQFEDLKQFIDSRISQSERQIKGELLEVNSSLQRLEQKVDDGFAGIAEVIDDINKHFDEHEKESNLRLTKLEQQAT